MPKVKRASFFQLLITDQNEFLETIQHSQKNISDVHTDTVAIEKLLFLIVKINLPQFIYTRHTCSFIRSLKSRIQST